MNRRLAEPAATWAARAGLQVETTYYRLTCRNLFYDDLGQLPLPPREQWKLVVGAPERRTGVGPGNMFAGFAQLGHRTRVSGQEASSPELHETGVGPGHIPVLVVGQRRKCS